MNYTLTVPRPMGSAWRSYCRSLEEKPLISRCLTGLVGTIISDATAQYAAASMSKNKTEVMQYDFMRTARLCAYSFCIGTPLGYNWFKFLDTAVLPTQSRSAKAVVMKTLLDQLIMSPLGTALFFVGIKALEGRPEEIGQMFKDKYIPSMTASYAVWPLVHLVGFNYIPPSQRILYVNAVSIMWGTFMSHMVMSKAGHTVAPASRDYCEAGTDDVVGSSSGRVYMAGRRVVGRE